MSKFIKTRINGQITAKEVRLIGPEGEQLGVVNITDALTKARAEQFDLVEVAPQAAPPVCRIMDYTKFKYDQNKKLREAKKKQKAMHIKELRLKPKIQDHDYLVKLKQLEKFLTNHDKVKVRMTFRGREMAHMEFGMKILERLQQDIVNVGEVEKPAVREGRNVIVIIKPK